MAGFRISMRLLKARSMGLTPRDGKLADPIPGGTFDLSISEEHKRAPVRRLSASACKAYEAELLVRRQRTGR
jgi:hypothetical protein